MHPPSRSGQTDRRGDLERVPVGAHEQAIFRFVRECADLVGQCERVDDVDVRTFEDDPLDGGRVLSDTSRHQRRGCRRVGRVVEDAGEVAGDPVLTDRGGRPALHPQTTWRLTPEASPRLAAAAKRARRQPRIRTA
jgi:hypothetical protein